MGLLPGSDSGICRLTINAHETVDCSDTPDSKTGVFVCQMNPEKVSYSFGIESSGGDNSNSADGASAAANTGFQGFNTMDMNFTFIADATGIVPVEDVNKDFFGEDDKPTIRPYLNHLQNVIYGYKAKSHTPPYLSFVWGNIFPNTANDDTEDKPAVFKGKLKDCKIELELFSITGEPVKASITLQIESMVAADARPMGESPDVTHHIDISYGDKMTMHCNDIYGRYDSKICAAVADYNNLIDWDLKPGTQMVFPSIHMLNEKYLDKFEDVEIKPVNEDTEYEQMVDLVGKKKAEQYFKIFPCKDGSYPEA
ncbi:MAG: hypothetical protein MK207_14620 [Saprospiraceae bacterium]|nr:hypothetical protein [Saprospiraceae bacterium]